MKKCGILLILVMLLCGCASRETFETVEDEYIRPVMQEQREILIAVDEDAVAIQGNTGTVYLCDGYTVTVEVLAAGNLNGTVKTLTGFAADDLTVMETAASEVSRYDCAWAAVGESGDLVGRAVILDDGIYHYCVTVMADAEDAGTLRQTMDDILDSFGLA